MKNKKPHSLNQNWHHIHKKFQRSFLPYATKTALVLLATFILTAIVIRLTKPKLFTEFSQKPKNYFLRILSLNDRDLTQINITGNERVSKEEITSAVRETIQKSKKNNPSLIQNLIDEIKSSFPWIHHLTITRSMAGILNISVTEYKPFAIWQNGGEKYIIDKDGNTVPYEDSEEFANLVIISGNNANIHANSLFNIFAIDPNLNASLYSATWVGNRRWDIRFDNGLLIKLPEHNISDAWRRLLKIYRLPGSLVGLELIDLRIEDKTYLKYDNNVTKDITSS